MRKFQSFNDWEKDAKAEKEKAATNPKHLEDGLNRREQMDSEDRYGERERIETE